MEKGGNRMNYKINENNGKFEIYEMPTKQSIKTFDTKEKAKALMRKLNFGGGFDGLTPPFFLKKVIV
jgi:hypothetical protein